MLLPCSASVETPVVLFLDDLVEALVEDCAELLDAVDELEEPEELDALEALADGSFGLKVLLVTPKPIAAASMPLPPTVIKSVLFLAVSTNWPLPLSDAVTWALVGRSILSASIRSPIVSLPVEV